MMRNLFVFFCLALLSCFAWSQQSSSQQPQSQQPSSQHPPTATKTAETKVVETKVADTKQSAADTALKDMFEAKIKTEWDAIKNKDKKAYGELLADEYQGVEVDGEGERNKLQAINEVVGGNVFNYNLWGLKVTPLGPDAAFVIYEVTMQFPPRSQLRFSRVYIGALWVKRDGQWKELHYQETHVK
jgi:hypothetical protein